MQKCSITVHREDQNQKNIMLLYRIKFLFLLFCLQG